MSEQAEMDRKGRCAYEAWMRGCGSMPFVPWDRLDECDRQHHVEWAQRYEVMMESKPEAVEQMAFDWAVPHELRMEEGKRVPLQAGRPMDRR